MSADGAPRAGNGSASEKKGIAPRGRYHDLFRFIWAASYFMGIGVYLAATVCVCIWLGMQADAFFDTAPKGLIAGIALGFPMAVYSIYYKVRRYFPHEAEDTENR